MAVWEIGNQSLENVIFRTATSKPTSVVVLIPLDSSYNIFLVGKHISHCDLHLSISCTFHKIS